ncbi:MAG: TfoX/Sxy family protein [Chloroflexota bacterium]
MQRSPSLVDLKNIGPQTAEWLPAVGIHTPQDLAELGAVAAYTRLKTAFPQQINLTALWALQGALMDIPFNQLPEAVKDDLRRQLRENAT